MVRFLTIVLLICIFICPLLAQWSNGQAADVVIGQPNMTSTSFGTSATTLSTSLFTGGGIVYDSQNAKLYILDTYNSRVLRFSYPPGGFVSNQPTAEAVLGQPDLTTGTLGTTSQKMGSPVGGVVLDDTLWVAEYSNNRVVGFYGASTKTSGAAADVVLGQPIFTSSTGGTTAAVFKNPGGVTIDPNTRDLYIADFNNHRVLKFLANNKLTGASANLVFGQANFTTGTSGTTSNQFKTPWKVLFYNNNLFVVDYGNNRVVRFNNARSISSNQPTADVVFGQPDLSTVTAGSTSVKLSGPTGAVVDGAGRLYVSDQTNNRALIFPDAFTSGNGATASTVIGQINFTSFSGGSTSTTLNTPDDIGIDVPNKKLFVFDSGNNRVMQYTAGSVLPVEISSFIATTSGSGTLLSWKTATEVNNFGFEIEKSRIQKSEDGSQKSEVRGQNTAEAWEKIGFVEGHGTTNAPKEYSFVDNNIPSGSWSYRLKQIDRDGKFEYSNEVEVSIVIMPTELALDQNYPNPFNPSTVIGYQIPVNSHVSLKIFDAIGREVATLVNEVKEAGYYSAPFDAAGLSSGIYFAKLQSGNTMQLKKMVLMK